MLFIYSAFTAARSAERNAEAHERELQYLEEQGLSYKQAEGRFEGSIEKSIVLNMPSSMEYFVAERARMLDQIAYLKVYKDNTTELAYSFGREAKVIGKFTQVKPDAIENSDYTRIGGNFYTVK